MERKIEQKYITSFVKDAEDNIADLKGLITTDSLWLAIAQPNLIATQNKSLSLDSAKSVDRRILQINRMDIHSGTYDNISNSGNLNLISNFELKTKIVDYHLSLEGAGFIDDHFYNYFNDLVMPFVFSEFNVLDGEFKDSEVMYTIRFVNIFAGYYSMVQQRNQAYKDLLQKSYQFKQDLTDRLD